MTPPGSIVSTGSQRSELQLSARAPPSRPRASVEEARARKIAEALQGDELAEHPGAPRRAGERLGRGGRQPHAPAERSPVEKAPVIRPFDVSEVPKGDDALGELL
jgi:hypothetical protein